MRGSIYKKVRARLLILVVIVSSLFAAITITALVVTRRQMQAAGIGPGSSVNVSINFIIAVVCVILLVTVVGIVTGIKSLNAEKEREEKRMQEEARETDEARSRLQTILDMMPIGIRILSMDNLTLLYSNKACLDIFGCSSFEDQVKGLSGFGFMPEFQPDGRRTEDVVKEHFESGSQVIEMQCLKLDGTPFFCRITDCVVNYNGQPASLAAMEDITQERERQQTLEKIALREQEANQLKTRFLANMSHEVRTPMNAILGITEIELQNEELPDDARNALGYIYESGNLLLNIINDILDLSKIEAGKLDIIPAQYSLTSLIGDTVQLNRLRYEDKPIEFVLEIDENTPVNLYGDELRIKQILNNIMSNAYKYSDNGTVKLAIRSEPAGSGASPGGPAAAGASPADGPAAAGVSSSEPDINLIFTVSDTGHGMTKDQVEKLFTEFTRFNLHLNRSVIGTGLGMSITKYLVDLMNGEIQVTSEVEKGSVFTVSIPQKRLDDAVCGSGAAEKLSDFNFRNAGTMKSVRMLREYMPYGKVLVVDDVESNLYVTKGMLLPYGLEIETANCGVVAIEKIKAGSTYDIIFMDHMMPRIDGIEATKILRDMGYTNTVIALTANALVGQEDMFLKNGFDGYISKPIDSRELNSVLNEFIRNRKPPDVVREARREQAQRRGRDGNGYNNGSGGGNGGGSNGGGRDSGSYGGGRGGGNGGGGDSGSHTGGRGESNGRGEAGNVTLNDAGAGREITELEKFFILDAGDAIGVLTEIISNAGTIGEAELDTYEITVHGIKSALRNIGEHEHSDFAFKLEQAVKNKDIETMLADTPALIDTLKAITEKLENM